MSLTAGLVLILSAVGALPVAANSGDVWTQPGGTAEETSGHSQEVHLPCGNVDIWGDKLDAHSGTWVVYHKPPTNTDESEVTQGTFGYSGEGSMKIATIALAGLQSATGPHFKLEVNDGSKKSKTFWLDCKISIRTATNPSAAAVGATLNDSATLSNGFSPTGTITFTLFNPSGAVAHTESVNVHGNGTYPTAGGHVADQVGTWYWQAAYSGNGGNDPVTSCRTAEPVIISKAGPQISTATDPAGGVVGTTLKDTATLSGGFQPTGTIAFTLYDPNDNPAYTENATVSGNGSYSTAHGFVANTAGTWHWSAAYGGDAKNKAVSSLKADEPVVVTEAQHQAQPSITTAPNPTSAIVGSNLNDTATLSGGDHPTGTITFTLYDPNGSSAYTEIVTVTGNGSYSTAHGFAANMAGTWHWSAAYSGDAKNKAVHSLMADEPVVVTEEQHQAQPSISTVANPTSAIVGVTLQDTATLSGGNHPTGTITFTLYDPNGSSAYTENVTVTGNGSYSTAHGFMASMVGTWHWSAAYGGDEGNKAVHSLMADEPVVIGQAQASITTSPDPTSAIVGATLKDTATLSGYHPTGTITFTLYDPNGSSAYTENVTVTGNGSYSTAHGFMASMVGTWHWSAAYSGDTNNKAVHSLMADEPVAVTGEQHKAQPSIVTEPLPGSLRVGNTLNDSATLSGGNSPTGHITFTLYDPDNTVAHTETIAVDGNGTYTTAEGFVPNLVGTWHWKAVYEGDESNLSATSLDEEVTVAPALPSISTITNPASVTGSATLQDSATLSGGYHPTGNITFTLYDPNGAVAHTETVSVEGNGLYTTAQGQSVNVPGTWHWKAEYSGDANNSAVASNPADEPVIVTGTGEVLANTGSTSPAQAMALFLVGFGALAFLVAAVAWRRRAA